MRSSVVVAIGGITGASIRWLVAEILGSDPAEFPWATLVVNVVGCFAIGAVAARLVRHRLLWDAIVIGLLGGLTTFSAFAVETRQLIEADRPGVAFVYVAVSVIAGLGATTLAEKATRR